MTQLSLFPDLFPDIDYRESNKIEGADLLPKKVFDYFSDNLEEAKNVGEGVFIRHTERE